MTTLGERIREARGSMSQERLAEVAGISRVTLARAETDKQAPAAETLWRIAQATGREMGWFFGEGEGSVSSASVQQQEMQNALLDLREARERLERAEERLRRALAPVPDRVAEPAVDDLAARRARVSAARREIDLAAAASQREDATPEAEERFREILAETFEEED